MDGHAVVDDAHTLELKHQYPSLVHSTQEGVVFVQYDAPATELQPLLQEKHEEDDVPEVDGRYVPIGHDVQDVPELEV